MGGGGFLKGAALGVLGTMQEGYSDMADEEAMLAKEERAEQARIRAEKRAADTQKRAEQFRHDRDNREKQLLKDQDFVDSEARLAAINKRYGTDHTDITLAEDFAKKRTSAEEELRKQRTLRDEGLGGYRPSKEDEPKGLTAADARATFNDALQDITGSSEKGAEPGEKRRDQLAEWAKSENGDGVYNMLTAEVEKTEGKWNPFVENKDVRAPDAKMSRDLKQLRDELVWTMGRTERSRLNKASKNTIMDTESVFQGATDIVARADAGLEEAKNAMEVIRQNGIPQGKTIDDVYAQARERLYNVLGYGVNDPTAIAAKKLWAVQKNGIDAILQ